MFWDMLRIFEIFEKTVLPRAWTLLFNCSFCSSKSGCQGRLLLSGPRRSTVSCPGWRTSLDSGFSSPDLFCQSSCHIPRSTIPRLHLAGLSMPWPHPEHDSSKIGTSRVLACHEAWWANARHFRRLLQKRELCPGIRWPQLLWSWASRLNPPS